MGKGGIEKGIGLNAGNEGRKAGLIERLVRIVRGEAPLASLFPGLAPREVSPSEVRRTIQKLEGGTSQGPEDAPDLRVDGDQDVVGWTTLDGKSKETRSRAERR